MGRSVLITIKNLELGKPTELLKRPEVQAFAKKHNYAAKMTSNIFLSGIRVEIPEQDGIYFPVYDRESMTPGMQIATQPTVGLDYQTKGLFLPRAGHHRKFPALFGKEKEVIWFQIGLQASVGTLSGVFSASLTKKLASVPPTISFVGDCEDSETSLGYSSEQQAELNDIVNGNILLDIVVEVAFDEIKNRPEPDPETTVAVHEGGISRKIGNHTKIYMLPTTVRGVVEYELYQDGPLFHGKAYLASVENKDEARLFLDLKAVQLLSGMDADKFLDVLHSDKFTRLLQEATQ